MKIYLLRHGETAYNVDHRYQGVTDIPLSPTGLAALKQADFLPKTVYVTPLKRTKQTAEILFLKRFIAFPSFHLVLWFGQSALFIVKV